MRTVQRFGLVIGTNPEKIEKYKELHSDGNSSVRDLLEKYHLTNFSIFIKQLPDGKEYLFGYYEYVGENYQKDMEKLNNEPRNIEWLKICDPCQIPLPGETSWAVMSEIFYNS